jgi:hypothetical protein
MKCPKCEGKGWVWLQRTEHVSIADICQTCNGTGEVFGETEQLKSRSVQRREALQKGEPMPEFDKPEMPERIWAKDFPEAKQPTGKMGGWVEWSDTTHTEYLRADLAAERCVWNVEKTDDVEFLRPSCRESQCYVEFRSKAEWFKGCPFCLKQIEVKEADNGR